MPLQSNEDELSNIIRNMYIGSNELEIEEIITELPTSSSSSSTTPTTQQLNLQTNILYYTIPNEDFAGLIRKVTFTNLDDKTDLYLDGLDGLAELIPYGLGNGDLDSMFRTREAWMHVYHTETETTTIDQLYQNNNNNNKDYNKKKKENEIPTLNITTIPYYHITQSTEDSMNVNIIKNGHFVVSYFEEKNTPSSSSTSSGKKSKLLPIIYDPAVIFGSMDSDMLHPISPFNTNELKKSPLPSSTSQKTGKNTNVIESRINEVLKKKQVTIFILLQFFYFITIINFSQLISIDSNNSYTMWILCISYSYSTKSKYFNYHNIWS